MRSPPAENWTANARLKMPLGIARRLRGQRLKESMDRTHGVREFPAFITQELHAGDFLPPVRIEAINALYIWLAGKHEGLGVECGAHPFV